jgi:hypothetical protein
MNYYLISDEQLDLMERNGYCIEIIREGRRDPSYTNIMNEDGTYTRHYYSDERLKDEEILVHFFFSREVEKESFVLKAASQNEENNSSKSS